MTDRIAAVADDEDQVRKVGIEMPNMRGAAGGGARLALLRRTALGLLERSTPISSGSDIQRDQGAEWPGQGNVEDRIPPGDSATTSSGAMTRTASYSNPLGFQRTDQNYPIITTRWAASSCRSTAKLRDGGQMTPTVPSTNSRAPLRSATRR